MAFFSFFLFTETVTYLSEKIEPNQKYYSKDIALWKHLNNQNKKKNFLNLKIEKRLKINKIGKKILFCLPPKFGLGDAIEYANAIKSISRSGKYSIIGIAFCGDYSIIFKKYFLFSHIYSTFISDEELNKYDTIFHITLEIEALKYQKYQRSNIALEICKYFKVPLGDSSFKEIYNTNIDKKTISIFPISTSTIRTLPYEFIVEIVKYFSNSFRIKIIIDDSLFSKYLEEKNKENNFWLVKPKNIQSLIMEISKTYLGIFMDSGPLHLAKILNIQGVLIETSVNSDILLANYKKIKPIKNLYKSQFCQGPCGLVDIFQYNNKVGCYETNKISFNNIKFLKSFKNLQRWGKEENNIHYYSNPVSCVKKINIKNILKLIQMQLKENR